MVTTLFDYAAYVERETRKRAIEVFAVRRKYLDG